MRFWPLARTASSRIVGGLPSARRTSHASASTISRTCPTAVRAAPATASKAMTHALIKPSPLEFVSTGADAGDDGKFRHRRSSREKRSSRAAPAGAVLVDDRVEDEHEGKQSHG